jgi:hypothetical protein
LHEPKSRLTPTPSARLARAVVDFDVRSRPEFDCIQIETCAHESADLKKKGKE